MIEQKMSGCNSCDYTTLHYSVVTALHCTQDDDQSEDTSLPDDSMFQVIEVRQSLV